MYVFYFNKLLKNVAYFKINAIILESSPIDLLIGRKEEKKDQINRNLVRIRSKEKESERERK